MRLPHIRIALEVVERLQELHADLQEIFAVRSLGRAEMRIGRQEMKRTYGVGTQLIEQVDSQLPHGLMLVEKAEAKGLQAV